MKRGDKVNSNKGSGIITEIELQQDGRYVLTIKGNKGTKKLLEGDDTYNKV